MYPIYSLFYLVMEVADLMSLMQLSKHDITIDCQILTSLVILVKVDELIEDIIYCLHTPTYMYCHPATKAKFHKPL